MESLSAEDIFHIFFQLSLFLSTWNLNPRQFTTISHGLHQFSYFIVYSAMDAKEEGYKPEAGFQEDTREPLVDLTLTDSTELWLIQWPLNELPDFQGTEVPLNLHGDGCVGSFEDQSGKAYDVVSCATQEPNAAVFLSSASETKFVGNISRRVALVHYPDPKELEREEAEKKSKRLHQMSAGSSMTPTKSSALRNPSSSRATHSSRHKSSLSEVGEKSSDQRRKKHKRTTSTDRSTLDSGRGHSGMTLSGSSDQFKRRVKVE